MWQNHWHWAWYSSVCACLSSVITQHDQRGLRTEQNKTLNICHACYYCTHVIKFKTLQRDLPVRLRYCIYTSWTLHSFEGVWLARCVDFPKNKIRTVKVNKLFHAQTDRHFWSWVRLCVIQEKNAATTANLPDKHVTSMKRLCPSPSWPRPVCWTANACQVWVHKACTLHVRTCSLRSALYYYNTGGQRAT